MKVIETIGIPGSGKSTINNLLFNGFKGKITTPESVILEKNIRNNLAVSFVAKSRVKKVFTNQFYAKYGPGLLSQFILENQSLLDFVLNSAYFKNQPGKDKSFILKWFFKLMMDYQIVSPMTGKYFLFDEGFVHKSISLLINPGQDKFEDTPHFYSELDIYLDLIPKPIVTIYIDVDVDIAFERLKKRGFTQRTKNFNESQIFTYLNFCNNVIRYNVHFLKARDCEVITLNNNQDVSKLKDEIKQKVRIK